MASENTKATVYLSLGSNLGDRMAYFRAAQECLSPTVEILRQSPIYETVPWGYADQPDFLNMVVEGATEMAPIDLLYRIKTCERDAGRRESFHLGPREIDIDILLYGDRVVDEIGLKIPHPYLTQRAFALRPLKHRGKFFRRVADFGRIQPHGNHAVFEG